MQYDRKDLENNPDNLIVMDDDTNELKSQDKNQNIGYIPSGQPVQEEDNQLKLNVKNNNQGNNNNWNYGSNNYYGVGLQVENLTLEPKQPHQNIYPPFQSSFQPLNQKLNGQVQGTQLNQFGMPAPYAGGFYGGDNQGGMVMPGIPIQISEQPQANQNIGGLGQNAIVVIDGDQQIRQQLIFRIRKNTKWFTGCNACFTVLLVINLLNKISLYNNSDDDSSSDKSTTGFENISNNNDDGNPTNNLLRASAVISIIEYILWFIFIILAIHGLTSSKLHFVRYYIKGLILCICMEILANILIFVGFGDQSGVKKVSYVIIFILTILILYSFIKNAKNLLFDIEQYKNKFGGNPISDQLQPVAPPVGVYNQQMANTNINNYMQNPQQLQQGYQYQNGNGINQYNNHPVRL
ncbi:hypothetical protein ABPG72_006896 [Tetrahymena utriculariae]